MSTVSFKPFLEGLTRKLPKWVDIAPQQFNLVWDFWKPICGVYPRMAPSSSYSDSGLDPPDELIDGLDEYAASVLSPEAMFKGCTRYTLPRVIFPEKMLNEMLEILHLTFGPYFIGQGLSTLEEVCKDMDLTKSPGWPLYYWYHTKLDAIFGERPWVKDCLDKLMKGEPISLLHGATLKDELLSASKVAKSRSRIFQNVAMPYIFAGAMLFKKQNDSMKNHLLDHPNTIGIDVPGPGFVNMFCKLSTASRSCSEQRGWDDDDSSWDALFNPGLSAIIRDVRSAYLPVQLKAAVDNYYNEIYCGFTVIFGYVVRWWCQKSGQLNTGDDNSLAKYCIYWIPYKRMNPDRTPKDYIRDMKIYTNGDDGAGLVINDEINFHPVAMVDILAEYAIYLEITCMSFKPVRELIYLSHTLVRRFVSGRNMWIYAVGGRRDKMISGLRWRHKKDDAKSLNRYYALCNGLWPWEQEYKLCLAKVDDWVAKHPRNKLNDIDWHNAKKTRLTDDQLFQIHTGLDMVALNSRHD